MNDFKTLRYDRITDHVSQITLNRPEAANALNTQMGRDLLTLFSGLILDPNELRCLIVTGAGERAFCAGGDLRERNGMSDADWTRQHAIFEQAFYSIMDCPVPVIAAVNGAAYGGGAEIALACDFIHAAQRARFALTEPRLGIIPGGGGTQNLPRAVGLRRAKELIYAARPFSAKEAESWGMVNHIWPDDALLPGVVALAKVIAENGPIAVRQAKRAMTIGYDAELKTGLAIEIEAYNRTVPTADRREGVQAFNEKRQPRFTGA
jgi:enoyl-CoA hydratase